MINLEGFSAEFSNETNSVFHGKNEILSRRKRFLIFDEGSSFQIVFCLTYPLVSAIGDIVLLGSTAALSFELPQDPYSPFNHHADPLHRRTDSKFIYYMDEAGKIIDKRPYKNKFVVKPTIAKRSVDRLKTVELKKELKIDRKQMHASKHKREFLKSKNMDRRSVEFNRNSRSALYRKIETMLEGLGGSGRQCMLKTLCLVGQTRQLPQGSFFQEILRAVFTLPKGESQNADEQEYDKAHSAEESCDDLYPECEPLDEAGPRVIKKHVYK
ncbi:uncharacterized protein LOC113234861 [Hyposmocoma kahamanoa]|uniref:uncharacterized protein LOC113234861 n=1 Tax=Hyposmocoma kahamanoa TaxID=1477025 RepID=UPI000E6D753E|nr:uncharacterized protein LOC113234861 [Hyposmocoma kahamanoa]